MTDRFKVGSLVLHFVQEISGSTLFVAATWLESIEAVVWPDFWFERHTTQGVCDRFELRDEPRLANFVGRLLIAWCAPRAWWQWAAGKDHRVHAPLSRERQTAHLPSGT